MAGEVESGVEYEILGGRVVRIEIQLRRGRGVPSCGSSYSVDAVRGVVLIGILEDAIAREVPFLTDRVIDFEAGEVLVLVVGLQIGVVVGQRVGGGAGGSRHVSEDLLRHRIPCAGRPNEIIRERIPNRRGGTIGAGGLPGRRRVIDGAIDHLPPQAIQDRRSIVIHDGTQQERAQVAITIGCRGNGDGSIVEGLGVVVLLESEGKEGFVAAVVDVRNPHRSTERAAKIQLPLHGVILLAA